MFAEKGGFAFIDVDGSIVSSEKMSIQDLHYTACNDNYYAVAGARRNNIILFSKDGNWEETFLLDNPNYTGVTAIEILGNNIIAVMNGSVSNDKYTSLFVRQNIDSDAYTKCEIDIWAEAIIIENNTALILGTTAHPDSFAKIIEIDIEKTEILQEVIIPEFTQFTHAAMSGEKIFAIARDENYESRIICAIDRSSLSVDTSYATSFEYIGMLEHEEEIYVVSENQIEVVSESLSVNRTIDLPFADSYEGSMYIDAIEIYGSAFLITYRYDQRIKNANETIYGYWVRIDISSGAEISSIPITLPPNTNDIVHNIRIIPNEFFNKH
jgi:hypothetical protein